MAFFYIFVKYIKSNTLILIGKKYKFISWLDQSVQFGPYPNSFKKKYGFLTTNKAIKYFLLFKPVYN